jgi:hypothetical protein
MNHSVSRDDELDVESQRVPMTKMRCNSPCELKSCPDDKNIYASDLYLYKWR